MLDAIVLTGQLFVGFVAIIITIIMIVLASLEIFDRVTGADEKRQEEADELRRLKTLEEQGDL